MINDKNGSEEKKKSAQRFKMPLLSRLRRQSLCVGSKIACTWLKACILDISKLHAKARGVWSVAACLAVPCQTDGLQNNGVL
jgi:hypothetical protein